MSKNKFYTYPSDDIMVDVDCMFNVRNGIVNVGVEEAHQVISGSENIIVLAGLGFGDNRIINAIENAVVYASRVSPNYNLFKAEKVVIKLIYPKSDPLKLLEMDAITQFAEQFPSTTSFIWGISESETDSLEVEAQIIASNLKLNEEV